MARAARGCERPDVVPALTTLSLRHRRSARSALPLLVGGRVEVLGREEAARRRAAGRRGSPRSAAPPWCRRRRRPGGCCSTRAGRALPRPARRCCGGEALPRDAGGGAARPRGVRAVEPLRPHRDRRSGRRPARSAAGEGSGAASAGRSPTRSCYVLDRELRPVPVGVAGRAVHRRRRAGARLPATGPDLTAERFVPDPFGSARARGCTAPATWCAGWPDGDARVPGPHRPPGEGARLPHRAGRDRGGAARSTRRCARPWWWCARTAPGDKRLVAYVVPAGDGAAPRRSCASYLRQRAARVHGAVGLRARWSALPLTPNGKVDRKALPAPGGGRGGARRRTPPRARPTEELLAGIWAEVLRRRARGRRTTTSSRWAATRCWPPRWSRASARAFGVELPLRALFEAPTVAALARARRGGARGAQERRRSPPVAPRAARSGAAAALLRPAAAVVPRPAASRAASAYNIPAARAAARRAGRRRAGAAPWPSSSRRHEALRTTLRATADGRAGAASIRPAGCALAGVDLSALPPDGARGGGPAAARAGGARALRPGARARCSAPRCCGWASEEHVLLLTMHHIVSDGWSMGVLRARAGGALRGLRRGPASPLPPLPVQYADYAAWQREWLQGEVLEAQLAYWQQQLAGAPPLLELPTDRPRPAVQTLPRRAPCRSRSPRTLLGGAARRWAGARAPTLFMTLLAAFQAAAGAATRGQDGRRAWARPSPAARRAEMEGLIGFFVNTLVLRTRPGGRSDASASCCGRCARRRWAPTPTRTCPSSGWWRRCSRSATSAARRCSR